MAQLIPGTIFKTPGFSKRELPYGFGVSAEEIIQKNYKDNANLGFVRLMDSPASSVYDAKNSTTSLLLLNQRKAEMEKECRLRGMTPRSVKPELPILRHVIPSTEGEEEEEDEEKNGRGGERRKRDLEVDWVWVLKLYPDPDRHFRPPSTPQFHSNCWPLESRPASVATSGRFLPASPAAVSVDEVDVRPQTETRAKSASGRRGAAGSTSSSSSRLPSISSASSSRRGKSAPPPETLAPSPAYHLEVASLIYEMGQMQQLRSIQDEKTKMQRKIPNLRLVNGAHPKSPKR